MRPADEILRRRGPTLQALEIVHDVVAHQEVFSVLGLSEEQTATAVQVLGTFAGSAGVTACVPDDEAGRERAALAARRTRLEEAPFMVPLMFLVLSKQFPALAVAECLSRARFGLWSADRRVVFFPVLSESAKIGVRWGVVTRAVQDLGAVRVSFVGPAIYAIRLESPWPAARFGRGGILWTGALRCRWLRAALLCISNYSIVGWLGWGEAALVQAFR